MNTAAPSVTAQRTGPSCDSSRRDRAASALVLGIAAAAWLAWGSSGAADLRVVFGVGMVAGVVLAVIAAVIRRTLPGVGSHASGRGRRANRVWSIAVAVEIAAIIGGNLLLNAFGQGRYAICWTFFVMSVHFLPLARFYRIPELTLTAGLGVLVAAAGVLVGVAGMTAPAPVVGGFGGALLLVSGVLQLLAARKVTT